MKVIFILFVAVALIFAVFPTWEDFMEFRRTAQLVEANPEEYAVTDKLYVMGDRFEGWTELNGMKAAEFDIVLYNPNPYKVTIQMERAFGKADRTYKHAQWPSTLDFFPLIEADPTQSGAINGPHYVSSIRVVFASDEFADPQAVDISYSYVKLTAYNPEGEQIFVTYHSSFEEGRDIRQSEDRKELTYYVEY